MIAGMGGSMGGAGSVPLHVVGEPIIVPNPDGSATSFVPSGPPLTVTEVDSARGTITVTADAGDA